MASLLERFRRARPPEDEAGPESPSPPRRRPLPPAGALRRERRVLLRDREERIRDLGGLVLEMYRRDRFRQDIVYEQTAQIVAIEDRLFQVDQLLALATSRGRVAAAQHCPQCGSPVLPGARFCANCGHGLAESQS
jgi:zinc-ribbon domain